MAEYYSPGTFPYIQGRGKLFIKKEGDSTWYDSFHCNEFKLTPSSEELKHENVSGGLKYVDASIVQKMELNGSFKIDVLTTELLRQFLFGETPAESTQSSGTLTNYEVTVVNPSQWHEIGKRRVTITGVTDKQAAVPTVGTAGGSNTGTATVTAVSAGASLKLGTYTITCTDATGTGTFSVTDPDSSSIGPATGGTPFVHAQILFTVSAGAALADSFTIVSAYSTLVENTDYVVNEKMGLIMPIHTSSKVGTAGKIMRITGTYIEHTITTIKAGGNVNSKMYLLFQGDPARGKELIVECYAVVRPSGDIMLIADEWMSLTFDFTCNEDATLGRYGCRIQEHGIITTD